IERRGLDAEAIERHGFTRDAPGELIRGLERAIDDQEWNPRLAQNTRTAARHRRDAKEGDPPRPAAQVLQHPVGREVAEGWGADAGGHSAHAARHAERLAHQTIQHRSASLGGARILPRTAQLPCYLVLAGLRGVESAG